jgi:hypothetical protein
MPDKSSWTPASLPLAIAGSGLLCRPPMRFSAPSALQMHRIGASPLQAKSGSTRTPSLLSLSQTLEGLILNASRGLVSYRSRSWGFALQGVPLQKTASGLVTRRFPHDVFPSHPLPVTEVTLRCEPDAPSGLSSSRSPFSHREYCIPTRAVTLLGFSASVAFGALV